MAFEWLLSAIPRSIVGGAVSGRLSYQHSHVSVRSSSDSVQIDFEIASKGGGFTRIVVALGKKDFPAILEIMSNVDRPNAIRAIMNELERQIFHPPKTRTKILV